MRRGCLFVFVVMSGYLVACQQQEPTSALNLEQLETAAVAQATVKSDAVKTTTSEVISETTKEIFEQVSTAPDLVDRRVKAAGKERKPGHPVPAHPVKQVSNVPSVPVEIPIKASETPVNVVAKAEEAVMPEIVEKVSGDPVKGAKLAKGKCGACHYFDKARKKIGPTLMGIFDRAPSIDGIPFAKWDAAALDAWITKPKAVKAKTKMGFKGISDKIKRDNVIAYLKTL